MDFEGFYNILKEIPDSVIKGGMAVPFHLNDPPHFCESPPVVF